MKQKKIFRFMLVGILLYVSNTFAVDQVISITATLPAWAIIDPSTTSARITLDGRVGADDYDALLLTLSLSHNSAVGYTIEIKSANNGKLVGASDSTKKIPYMISYDEKAPIPLSHKPQNIGGATSSVSGIATTPFIKNVNIIVNNADANSASQQDYEDTITFTLTGI